MLTYKSIQTSSSAKTQFFHCLITHKRTVKKNSSYPYEDLPNQFREQSL
jgi:hypothetical protein